MNAGRWRAVELLPPGFAREWAALAADLAQALTTAPAADQVAEHAGRDRVGLIADLRFHALLLTCVLKEGTE
ncbi:MAG: hypothetical protein HOV87_09830 [Catenulispora sp.]|nr:hypothetical protein [Catenulispora sp.]